MYTDFNQFLLLHVTTKNSERTKAKSHRTPHLYYVITLHSKTRTTPKSDAYQC